jgi:hypothetical protein
VEPIVALRPDPEPLTDLPLLLAPSTSMPGVPSFLIPRSAEVRPLAEGPPVADPLIDIEDEDDPCCCVDAEANACWNADIV